MEDKALDNNLTLKRKRIMIYFIEAAEKLIRQMVFKICLFAKLQQKQAITVLQFIIILMIWNSLPCLGLFVI